MHGSENCNLIQARLIFLFKLRTGNSDKLMTALLGIDQKRVNSSIHAVLMCFKNVMLSAKFGIYSKYFFISQII